MTTPELLERTSNSSDVPSSDEKSTSAALPQPLAILKRQNDDPHHATTTTFYILGTAHVSQKSCEDTKALIQHVRPDLVLVELCPERQALLSTPRTNSTAPTPKEPSLLEILAEIKAGRVTPFQGIYSWLLVRVGRDLDVPPGEEFRVAVKEAKAIGACVVLGDRPLSITLSRLWSSLSFLEKCRLLGTLLWSGLTMLDADELKKEIEKMKETDVLTEAIREVGKDFPSLLGPLITERDQYMVHVMHQLAGAGVSKGDGGEPVVAETVVAVVGAGHLEGIKKYWEDEIDIERIMQVAGTAEGSVYSLDKRRWWSASSYRRAALAVAGVGVSSLLVVGIVRWRQQHR